MEKATLAGGCFWGIQLDFDNVDGVVSTVVGYMGGQTAQPTYEQVCTGETNHAEVVEITYDPDRIDFASLLEVFWTIHNPTTLNAQGPDRGSQYRSVIFYHSEAQKDIAIASREACDASGQWPDPVVTEISPASAFWPAEEYHQHYLKKRGHTISCH
ncbi:peptide-methionine (S)-S-oxide reductase MsrA [Paremcibacter congregatus]|uniref:Peptide methionine sulfoxide reductase MsrA n=1 Tax=Paremcibacter congregatus TaxID=2043170 RepID=A0A2G4YQ89_9PROT|nr:peptide-methionine (S)-S-oxide reductase MsrA [Paremcibacter congregatus]PHZ84475.1 peptide-methionine (S)-S-oxide reductase [Paremcibacter congregatus]QDE28694.1 peptide-methionine (S)-S-oxide reductase MsrA [Paremcibacter congregatus]|tara:strand:+ start:6919 stop:7389 length:471 start_codon:yes stop_codon:yes gene_type:complete